MSLGATHEPVVTPPAGGGTPPVVTPPVTPPAAGGTPSWRDALPADIKDSPALQSFTDVGNLAKSYIHAQSQVGKKGVIVPDWGKATDQEKSEYYKAVGMPDPDKYEVTLPKGFTPDPTAISKFKELALKEGILPHQSAGIMNLYAEIDTAQKAAQKATKDAADKAGLEALKKEWGDGYNTNVEKARFAMEQIGGKEIFTHMDKLGISNDATLLKFMATASKLFQEDKLREGGVGEGGETPDQLRAQRADLLANSANNGLSDKSHPQHRATLEKLTSLSKRLTGGK